MFGKSKTQEQKELERVEKLSYAKSQIEYWEGIKEFYSLESSTVTQEEKPKFENVLIHTRTETEKPKEPSIVSELENNAMTLNYGKSKIGRKDWFFMGYTFPASFKMRGAMVSNTRLFIQGSKDMTEKELIAKWSKKVLKKLPKGFSLGGQRY